jgi:hypothetical protein
MAWLCCKPIGLVNLQLPVADVSWFIPCVLAAMLDSFHDTWPFVPALFFSTSKIKFLHLLRSSVIITTLACIIGVHKGFRQPSFKGAVGHDMTEITPGGSSHPGIFQFFGFSFQFATFRETKAGRALQDGHAEGKTWDMD